jgi:hypothetical protein
MGYNGESKAPGKLSFFLSMRWDLEPKGISDFEI